jgi:hypothetical protein
MSACLVLSCIDQVDSCCSSLDNCSVVWGSKCSIRIQRNRGVCIFSMRFSEGSCLLKLPQ